MEQKTRNYFTGVDFDHCYDTIPSLLNFSYTHANLCAFYGRKFRKYEGKYSELSY